MKRNALNEIKELDVKALFDKAKALKLEVAYSVMDRNMEKNKDLKHTAKKRKDLAQILTILRQKQLLQDLELKAENAAGIKTEPAEKAETVIKEDKKSLAKVKKGDKK